MIRLLVFFLFFFFWGGGEGGLKANGSGPGKTLYNEVCNQDVPSLLQNVP